MALDFASQYVATGVVRVIDGPAIQLESFRFEMDEVRREGSTVSGLMLGEQGQQPFVFRGTYNAEAARVSVSAGEGSVTQPGLEQVVRMEFIPEDGSPQDEVASDLSGWVDTATQGVTRAGQWLAIELGPTTVPPPRPDLISIGPSPRLGRFVLEGQPGASEPGRLQVLRFSPQLETPTVFSIAVPTSETFLVDLEALVGDILLLRTNRSGRYSEPIELVVPG